MLQAIVFDFDGIIADTEPIHWQAFVDVLRPHGVEFDYEQYLSQYIGYDDREAIGRACDDFGVPVDDARLGELIEAKGVALKSIVGRGVGVYDGVVELIRSAADQMPLAICSGALRSDIDLVLAGIGDGALAGRFSAIVTADQVPRSKPDPYSYALAVQQLNRPADSCLAIEDTAAGLISAKAAGLRTLAVTNTCGADQLAEADRIVDTLRGVDVSVLQSWFA